MGKNNPNKTIDLNDEGLDFDEAYEDDEEEHKDRGKSMREDQEDQTMWQLDWWG